MTIYFSRLVDTIMEYVGFVMSGFENMITPCTYLAIQAWMKLLLRYFNLFDNFIGDKFC